MGCHSSVVFIWAAHDSEVVTNEEKCQNQNNLLNSTSVSFIVVTQDQKLASCSYQCC